MESAQRLNESCLCPSLDVQRLEALLGEAGISFPGLRHSHPHVFSPAPVYVDQSQIDAMRRVVEAVERIVVLPAWKDRVLAYAPVTARYVSAAAGVFLGYDFHLSDAGPQLIEINTNAGGGLLNTRLLAAQSTLCEHADTRVGEAVSVEQDFVEMFREEWRLSQRAAPLRCIAIVDENPATQFLLPEFQLFVRLFEQAGITALIADPGELSLEDGKLICRGQAVDLVYNRLTDFSLSDQSSGVLREAWLNDAVVVTPHPHAHALYADKRNLVALSDGQWLRKIGVDAHDLAILEAHVPRTEEVAPAHAEIYWADRRKWFFKPAAGYGGKAAYRGDKLTKRVFAEIAAGGYIAQALVPPSERRIHVDGVDRTLKLDIRNFVYRGRVQLVSARLYQGQTTNFRTHGGGFAVVRTVA